MRKCTAKWIAAGMIAFVVLLAGCSSNSNEGETDRLPNNQAAELTDIDESAACTQTLHPPAPGTFSLFPWTPFPQHEVEMFIQQHLREIHPHITVELLDMPRKDLQNLIVGGNPPDLIAAAASFSASLQRWICLKTSPLM